MFDKEAEEYVNTHVTTISPISEQDLYDCFQNAATFGYNEANKRHYVNKEGLPEDKYKLLVRYVNGDYDIAFNFAGTWRGTSGNELRGVYAWKEIVPPKE